MSEKAKHPKALPYLFFAEMWERFGYYLMIGIFTLYLKDATHGFNNTSHFKAKDGSTHELAIGSGFAEIQGDHVNVLTDMAIGDAQIDACTAAFPEGRWFSRDEALAAGLPAPLRKLLAS